MIVQESGNSQRWGEIAGQGEKLSDDVWTQYPDRLVFVRPTQAQ